MTRRRGVPPLAPGDIVLFDDTPDTDDDNVLLGIPDDDGDDDAASVIGASGIVLSTSSGVLKQQIVDTRNALLLKIVHGFFSKLDPSNSPDPADFEHVLMTEIRNKFHLFNATADKDLQLRVPEYMDAFITALAIMWYDRYALIDFSDGQEPDDRQFVLCRYNPDTGLYEEVSDRTVGRRVRDFFISASQNYIGNVISCMRERCDVLTRTRDENLVPLNNGIYHYDTGELEPYNSSYVFTSKSSVDWDPDAESPVFILPDGSEWEFDAWLLDLFNNDEAVADVIWQAIAAVLRSNKRWNKAFFFYNTGGNAGKGTLLQLMRNIVGPEAWVKIAISEFNNARYGLGGLLTSQLVVCDENPVGRFVDDCADFKAAVTGDAISIDRKYRNPVSATFHGIIIQCFNDIPRVRDRSDSFWRRIVPVEFPKSFTGKEFPQIKGDFLGRPELLRYVVRTALERDYDEIKLPDSVVGSLAEFKATSNPVLDFFHEVVPQAKWEFWPLALAYDLYKEWMHHANPSGKALSQREFSKEFGQIIVDMGGVDYRAKPIRYMKFVNDPATGKPIPEPLLDIYGLTKPASPWSNSIYMGADIDMRCTPNHLPDTARGFGLPKGLLSSGFDEDDIDE